MVKFSLRKNLFTIALLFLTCALCENVQAEEYKNKAVEPLPGVTKVAPGDSKAPVTVYKESAAGDTKDRSKSNEGQVTKTTIAETQLNHDGVFFNSMNGQGEAKK